MGRLGAAGGKHCRLCRLRLARLWSWVARLRRGLGGKEGVCASLGCEAARSLAGRPWRPMCERAETAEAAKRDQVAKQARRLPALSGLGPVPADFEGASQRVRSSATGFVRRMVPCRDRSAGDSSCAPASAARALERRPFEPRGRLPQRVLSALGGGRYAAAVATAPVWVRMAAAHA